METAGRSTGAAGSAKAAAVGHLASMAVSVTRSSDGKQWIVTTDPLAGPLAGDEADLNANGTEALYHMPFQLTIDCLTALSMSA